MKKFPSRQKNKQFKQNKRLSILSHDEYQALYQFLHFNPIERQHYFDLSLGAKEAIRHLPIHSAVYFILQWGYFKAKQLFFSIAFPGPSYLKSDIKFVMQEYFPKQQALNILIKIPSRHTQSKIKQKILSLQGYEFSAIAVKNAMAEKAAILVRACAHLSEIFRELLQCAKEKK